MGFMRGCQLDASNSGVFSAAGKEGRGKLTPPPLINAEVIGGSSTGGVVIPCGKYQGCLSLVFSKAFGAACQKKRGLCREVVKRGPIG